MPDIRNATKRVNLKQSCSTRPHVHWRTRESKKNTLYNVITLQWQLGTISAAMLLQSIGNCVLSVCWSFDKNCFSCVNSVSDRTIKKQQTVIYNSGRFRYKYFPKDTMYDIF